MKFIKNILAVAIVATVSFSQMPAIASVLENPNGYNSFGGTGTTQGATNAWYVAGNYTLNSGTPTVRYLNVSSDLATSKVQFYVLTNAITVVSIAGANTNMVVSSTNLFAAGNIIVIKHITSDTYERLQVMTVALTNQITTTFPPIQAPAAGDQIWRATPSGFINIGLSTNNVPISGASFYSGQLNKPLLLEINGTAWAQINAVSGDYR